MFDWLFRAKTKKQIPEQLASLVQTRLTSRKSISPERYQELWAIVLTGNTKRILFSLDELEQLLDTIVHHENENGYVYPTCAASVGLFRYVMIDHEESIIDSEAIVSDKPDPKELSQIEKALGKKEIR